MAESCQVLVVGAGAAGALAAIAAARSGADTVLVEQARQPGGLGRTQLHRHVCGLFVSGKDEPGPILHGPLVQELCARLGCGSPLPHAGAVPPAPSAPQRMGRVWVWPLEVGQWSAALGEWLRETRHLRSFLGQRVEGFHPASDTAGTVLTTGDAGHVTFAARTVVDASGCALVGSLAGWDLDTPSGRQLAGCTLRLAGVLPDELLPYRVPDSLRRAQEEGRLGSGMGPAVFVPLGEGRALLRLNLAAGTPASLVDASAQQALGELRERCPALRDARPVECSPLEPRDGPRIRGHYVLRGEDVTSARRFGDAVARGAWPSERWLPEGRPRLRYPPAGECYEIPLRALSSPRSAHVLFAGRSLSADDEAAAAVRVMGICMATGEAAGREAARRAA